MKYVFYKQKYWCYSINRNVGKINECIKIAVIAGDGIGPEVINEGIKVLKAVAKIDGSFDFDFSYFPRGCDYYKETGKMMADNGI